MATRVKDFDVGKRIGIKRTFEEVYISESHKDMSREGYK